MLKFVMYWSTITKVDYNDWEVRIMEFRIDECIPDVVSMMALAQAIANFDLNGTKATRCEPGRMDKCLKFFEMT